MIRKKMKILEGIQVPIRKQQNKKINLQQNKQAGKFMEILSVKRK